jgi:hypothetical protein
MYGLPTLHDTPMGSPSRTGRPSMAAHAWSKWPGSADDE